MCSDYFYFKVTLPITSNCVSIFHRCNPDFHAILKNQRVAARTIMRPADERRGYAVTHSLIGWAHNITYYKSLYSAKEVSLYWPIQTPNHPCRRPHSNVCICDWTSFSETNEATSPWSCINTRKGSMSDLKCWRHWIRKVQQDTNDLVTVQLIQQWQTCH